MIKITQDVLNSLSRQASDSTRKRKNYNYHTSYEDPINRMLNAFEPETYVRPHKHKDPDKIEVFILLRGKVLAVEFDDSGDVTQYFIMEHNLGNCGVEFQPKVWHTIISLQRGTVLYEVKPGPYVQFTDKDFAPWAPTEGSAEALEYNMNIKQNLDLS